jgi:hypothetical protein
MDAKVLVCLNLKVKFLERWACCSYQQTNLFILQFEMNKFGICLN